MFLILGCRGFIVDLSYAYVPEFLAGDKGGQAQLLMSLSISIGSILLGPVFKGISPWELAYSLYQLLPFVLIFVLGLKFFEETPIEQVNIYTTQESKESLLRIASINGVECDIRDEEIDNIREEYKENELANQQHKISALDLFRFESLRVPTLLSLGMHFCIAYQFNATELVLNDFEMDFYLNGVILGSSHFFATIAALYGVNECPRKLGIIGSEVVAVGLGLVLLIGLPCT